MALHSILSRGAGMQSFIWLKEGLKHRAQVIRVCLQRALFRASQVGADGFSHHMTQDTMPCPAMVTSGCG